MSVSQISRLMNISRNSYYKRKQREATLDYRFKVLEDLVDCRREILPKLGGRKSYYLLKPILDKLGVKIGRDSFFKYLKQNNLLIVIKKKYVTTTDSKHGLKIYKNLTDGLQLSGPNQLWVTDITYLSTHQGFCFLAMITDAYSRKVVGYDVSDSLERSGCIRALKMAMRENPEYQNLIHHSDRGSQYCSKDYTQILQEGGIRISMADKGDCYQNALAERMNGIMKQEFSLDHIFPTKKQLYKATKEAVLMYNHLRPHMALENRSPIEIHDSQTKGIWKTTATDNPFCQKQYHITTSLIFEKYKLKTVNLV